MWDNNSEQTATASARHGSLTQRRKRGKSSMCISSVHGFIIWRKRAGLKADMGQDNIRSNQAANPPKNKRQNPKTNTASVKGDILDPTLITTDTQCSQHHMMLFFPTVCPIFTGLRKGYASTRRKTRLCLMHLHVYWDIYLHWLVFPRSLPVLFLCSTLVASWPRGSSPHLKESLTFALGSIILLCYVLLLLWLQKRRK